MTNIFLIGAEHQLFQVNIAITHFKIEKKNIILIIEKVSNNHKFIDKVYNSNLYGKVLIFESWTFKDLFRNPYKHHFFINLCSSFIDKEIIFFASHYDSDSTLLFNSIVKPFKYFLMDEGTASFSVQIQRNSSQFRTKLKGLIKSIFYKNQISLPKELLYFTKFDLDLPMNDHKVIYEEEKNDNPLMLLNKDELIFIGSSIVELKMIEEMDYISCLVKVITDNEKNTHKFYYYPHRKECVNKLNKIEKLGFAIRYLEEPFETFFNKQIKIASIICSFHTTSVIYNIACLNYKLPRLVIYRFDNYLLKTDRMVYESIYNVIKANKLINFVDI